jgi:flagellar basal-body rod modification protein FlgD
MMTVNTNTTTAASSGTATTGTTKSILGQDDFMKMLIAQLQNQDPLNPMDGTQFAAQLAQFSTVEQVSNMSTQLKTMNASIAAMNNTQMASLIGSQVTAQGNTISVTGSSSTLTYNLASAIQKGAIKIYNSNGVAVKSLDIGSQSAGVNSVTWDSSGLPTGTYTYDIAATDKNGVSIPATTMVNGTITGITYKDSTPYITVNGQNIAFSSVSAIKKPTTTN